MSGKQSWNPVLNKFIEIKQRFVNTFGEDFLWEYPNPDYDKDETCLEYWVRMLNIPEYKELITPLQFCEHKKCLLIRYANLGSISENGGEITIKNFWNVFDGLYRECRSVVIHVEKEELVLTPFKKFCNLNESEEYSIEQVRERIRKATCVEISEKLDGSMQSARYYAGNYIMAGSQALDAENSWRLEDGYELLERLPGYRQMLKDYPEETHIFECITLRDAHVVNYAKEQEGLYLIGIRNVNTGEEYSYREVLQRAERYQIPSTKVVSKNLDEVLNELDDKKSSEAEGFVINVEGFKVKIKYNDYCQMHRLLGEITSVNMIIQRIADGTYDDFISKVPTAYRKRVYTVAEAVQCYQAETVAEVERYFHEAPKGSRKEFMLWVESHVPTNRKALVREKYLHGSYHVLRKGTGEKAEYSYLKLSDMGIDLKGLFGKEDLE